MKLLRDPLGRPIKRLYFKTEELDSHPADPCWTCHRETIETAAENDWMEFQAGYIGGALLMPKSEVSLLVGEIAMREGGEPPLRVDSELGRAAIERIMRRCQVS